MRLFFASDLHINGNTDPLYQSFLQLIREGVRQGDVLVLGGDIFELFVSDKKIFLQRYCDFLLELRRAGERGVVIHYIEGNHDFLIKRALRGFPGLSVHHREFSLCLEGKTFYLAHGDLVDRSAYGYRLLRRLFRCLLVRTLIQVLPGKWVDEFGRKSSETSKRLRQKSHEYMVEGQQAGARSERLRKLFRNFAARRIAEGFDYVILGHSHDLDEMSFKVEERLGQYMNSGYPPIHGSFIVWDSSERDLMRVQFPSVNKA